MTQYLFTNRYQREEHDLYVEPSWCSNLLFKKVDFTGSIHDPSCGTGNIVRMAHMNGYNATGSDIADRGDFEIIDFFKDFRFRDNIVSNPPYNIAEHFIDHAMQVTINKIAVLVRLAFLEGQKRKKKLFDVYKPRLVLVFSSRPSIGPLGVPSLGGKTAYCWIIWDKRAQFVEDVEPYTELDWITN